LNVLAAAFVFLPKRKTAPDRRDESMEDDDRLCGGHSADFVINPAMPAIRSGSCNLPSGRPFFALLAAQRGEPQYATRKLAKSVGTFDVDRPLSARENTQLFAHRTRATWPSSLDDDRTVAVARSRC
jgi:hypothetical protein